MVGLTPVAGERESKMFGLFPGFPNLSQIAFKLAAR
jgi:hypothetical protein